jgi:4-diphosphocytidyl-2-C-methyl-D-erythritol kinase
VSSGPDVRRRVVDAPAKVNLWLHVLAREDSGFHQLETLFCALDLADRIEIRHQSGAFPGEVHIEVHDAELGPPQENLAYRAARLLIEETGLPGKLEIHLHKRIPAGAGLGGGSSDAAATLKAVNSLLPQPRDSNWLAHLGARLGSDVAFFLCGSPLALAWGRGERLLALPPLPAMPVVLATPNFSISTPEAYQQLDSSRAAAAFGSRSAAGSGREKVNRAHASLLDIAALASWAEVAARAHNDFELPIFRRYPSLAELREAMRDTAPLFALMAGSGSSLFAVYADEPARDAAAQTLAQALPDTTFIRTSTAAPVGFGARQPSRPVDRC